MDGDYYSKKKTASIKGVFEQRRVGIELPRSAAPWSHRRRRVVHNLAWRKNTLYLVAGAKKKGSKRTNWLPIIFVAKVTILQDDQTQETAKGGPVLSMPEDQNKVKEEQKLTAELKRRRRYCF